MRNLFMILMLLALSMSGAAQQKKWKAPKRPKRPKWETPKPVAPEVMGVWRPYFATDNLFVDIVGGMSVSMAENMSGHDFGDLMAPGFELGLGKQTSYLWSTRLTFGFKKQNGWASKEALAASTLLGDGDYRFNVASAYIEEMFSFTNCFCSYNEKRRFNLQGFVGLGMNYTFGFDKETDSWERYGYPIDNADHINLAARAGVQVQMKVSEPVDVVLRAAGNIVEDKYNGVKHSPNFAIDTYVDVSVGVVIHMMDHYSDFRYSKVRRREAAALRTTMPRITKLLEAERAEEFKEKEESETVIIGGLMNTRVSFYTDRTFVNDDQLENLRIVATFLRRHPDVNLVLKGYSGAALRSESPEMHLAEKRVNNVRKILLRDFNVDEKRITTWFDKGTMPPFPMRGEWIDGVVFQMVEK